MIIYLDKYEYNVKTIVSFDVCTSVRGDLRRYATGFEIPSFRSYMNDIIITFHSVWCYVYTYGMYVCIVLIENL